jgi:hypothetical protein
MESGGLEKPKTMWGKVPSIGKRKRIYGDNHWKKTRNKPTEDCDWQAGESLS